MKITSDVVLSVIFVVIVSSVLTRMALPYIMLNESFESRNTDIFSKILNHIDIVDIKQIQEGREWWNPQMRRAIKIKGLKEGLTVKSPREGIPSITLENIPDWRSGLRFCSRAPCSDSPQWSYEFSSQGDLAYRSHARGHMPSVDTNERKRTIYAPVSLYMLIPRNQSNVRNRRHKR